MYMPWVVDFKQSGKRFIYNKNKSGPKIDPWSTPHEITLFLDNSPLTLHCCFLFIKYDSGHFSSMPRIQNCSLILFNKMCWFIESIAFLISKNTTPFDLP